jgi:Holliday junction resolvasome RuvABC endonuclease subunit
VDNRAWKKVIIGKGNASKSEIMDFAISQWGGVFSEQDYADAACIALWRKRDGR